MEPIIDQSGCILACESLSRPIDHCGFSFNTHALINVFYECGKHQEIDLCTGVTALEHAKTFLADPDSADPDRTLLAPVTVNVSPVSLLNKDFMQEFIQTVYSTGLTLNDVIIEIVEHDLDPNADTRFLQDLKDQGLNFALDDFRLGDNHKNRLIAFDTLISSDETSKKGIIKFDGPIVRDYLARQGFVSMHEPEKCAWPKQNELECAIKKISLYFQQTGRPRPIMVAERVHTKEEMAALGKLGITGFQSHHLKELAFFQRPVSNPVASTTAPLAKEPVTWDHA